MNSFNPLHISVADVDIDMGFVVNHRSQVRLTFRRPIDKDVRDYLNRIVDLYRWEINSIPEFFDPSGNGLCIDCKGAKSDEVGNAIGESLTKDHGLVARYCQFVSFGIDCSRWTENVASLIL